MPASAIADDALVAPLRALPRDELTAMYEAAAEAVGSIGTLASVGLNPVTAAIAGAAAVEEWAHFPAGDVINPATYSRFYYHAHAADERTNGEHGHFHTFVRPRAQAPGVQPIVAPEATAADAPRVTHLVGISADASGRVIGLFTTNRWVTGEVWHDAEAVIGLLARFNMTHDEPSSALNRWVTAIVRMFRPQIVALLRARDACIAELRAAHPHSDVFEDRTLQIASAMPVDILTQIRAIETMLEQQRAA